MTPASEPAVSRAILLAKKCGAELWIAHVYRPPSLSQAEAVGPGVYDEWNQNLREGVERLLRPQVESARRQLVPARALALSGAACKAILQAARQMQADLIVVGTSGRRGLLRLFHRSLASRIASAADCRVMTVRRSADRRGGSLPPPRFLIVR